MTASERSRGDEERSGAGAHGPGSPPLPRSAKAAADRAPEPAPTAQPFHRVAQPPRPWWARDRLRRGPLLGALVLGLAALAGVAAAYRATGQVNATAQARAYREAGRRWLADDQPQRALPYLVAARRAGDESDLLKRMFLAAASGLEPRVLPIALGESRGAFSPDGSHVAIFTPGAVSVWNAHTGQQERELRLHAPLAAAPPYSVSFSSDGVLLALIYEGGYLVLDLTARAPLLRPLLHRRTPTSSGCMIPLLPEAPSGRIVFSRDAPVMALIAPNHVEVYETPTLRWIATLPSMASSIHLSPDGTRLVAIHGDGMKLWDVVTERELLTLPAVEGSRHIDGDLGAPSARYATDAAFAPDGATFALLTFAQHNGLGEQVDSYAELRSAASGALIRVLRAPPGVDLFTSQLTLSSDGLVHVDPREPFDEPFPDRRSQRACNASLASRHEDLAQRSADASMLVTIHPSYGVRLWEAATSAPLTPWFELEGCVTSAIFSADGDHLFTTGDGGGAAIWDLRRDPRSLAEWERVLERSRFPTMAAARAYIQ
jgi:WD40 repeat protein